MSCVVRLLAQFGKFSKFSKVISSQIGGPQSYRSSAPENEPEQHLPITLRLVELTPSPSPRPTILRTNPPIFLARALRFHATKRMISAFPRASCSHPFRTPPDYVQHPTVKVTHSSPPPPPVLGCSPPPNRQIVMQPNVDQDVHIL
jgi:hypothetical protein